MVSRCVKMSTRQSLSKQFLLLTRKSVPQQPATAVNSLTDYCSRCSNNNCCSETEVGNMIAVCDGVVIVHYPRERVLRKIKAQWVGREYFLIIWGKPFNFLIIILQ